MTATHAMILCAVALCAFGALSALRAMAEGRPAGGPLAAFVLGGGALAALQVMTPGGIGLSEFTAAMAALGRDLIALAP